MRLWEVMEPTRESVSANDYAAEALQRMRNRGCDWAFVLDRNEVVGLVFARDLERQPPDYLQEEDVRRYMTTRLILIGPDIASQEAERLLRLSRQDFLAVVEDHRPVGIVTAHSLIRCADQHLDYVSSL
jgi:CBS domain-containing protein